MCIVMNLKYDISVCYNVIILYYFLQMHSFFFPLVYIYLNIFTFIYMSYIYMYFRLFKFVYVDTHVYFSLLYRSPTVFWTLNKQ